jgi:hypothetical protein
MRGLFDSKKAAVLVAGIVMYLATRLGLGLTEADAGVIGLMVSSYLVGQGIADHGKEAAKLKGGA